MPLSCFPYDNHEIIVQAGEGKHNHAHTADQVLLPRQSHLVEVPVSDADVHRWSESFAATLKKETSAKSSPISFYLPGEVMAMQSAAIRREAVHPFAPLPCYDYSSAAEASKSITQLLRHRREWLPYRKKIPVHQHRIQILDALCKHSVLSVVGARGCGKTLQLPQVLSETDALKRSRIVLVTSSEAAARLAVRRLTVERGDAPAASAVASASALEINVTAATSIAVTSPDVLLRQLLCDPSLINVGAVIFDDFHLRTEVTELCLSLIRELLVISAVQGVPPLGSQVRVIVNCVDEEAAQSIQEFFAGVSTATVALTPMTTAPPPSVLYLEETVQWLNKCATEGVSSLCLSPDEDLAGYAEKVEVVTQIMAAAEADFLDAKSCRQYWCGLMKEALGHYDAADRRLHASRETAPLPLVLIIVPGLKSIVRLVNDALHEFIESNSGVRYQVHNLQEFSKIEELLPSVISTNESEGGLVRHLLLGEAEMLQAVVPPSVDVGLVIDFARCSTCVYHMETGADHWVTDSVSLAQLRHRRRLGNAHGSSIRPLIIQLIPKSALHIHRRRVTADANHTIFHLPSEQYLKLYQVFQLRDDIATAAEKRGYISSHSSSSTTTVAASFGAITSKVSTLLSQSFFGVPASTSNKYEQSKRVFQQQEAFLRAAGQLSTDGIDTAVLQPLGVLSTCWLFPLPISRLLAFGLLFNRPLEASAVAALWLTGDSLSAFHQSARYAGDQEKEHAEELLLEVQRFFSHDNSDVAGMFYLYKMWLDQRQKGSEEEQAFLSECNADVTTLERTLLVHAQLYLRLHQMGLLWINQPENEEEAGAVTVEGLMKYLAKAMVLLSDDRLEEDDVQAVISAALYPHCGVPRQSSPGTVQFYDPSQNTRFGLFDQSSLFREAAILKRVSGLPVVYLSRLVSHRHHHFQSAIPVISQCMLLNHAASVVLGGQEREQVLAPPTRCRGWNSPLTAAWRRTRCSRLLPPTLEVPPTSSALQPFDTVHGSRVVVRVDQHLEYVMRSTTALWLRQLRQFIQSSFHLLVSSRDGAPSFKDHGKEVEEAWQWWTRRGVRAAEWLREERSDAQHSVELQPFYDLQTTPGSPTLVVVAAVAGAAAQNKELSDTTGLAVYTGKRPGPDVDSIIRSCVERVASSGSRRMEGKLLEDSADAFAFLHPASDLHEYYLYRLKEAAPHLEVLGDDLETLITFLANLEEELCQELGLDEEEGKAAAESEAHLAPAIHVEEVNEEEGGRTMTYGVQEEEAVHLLKNTTVRPIHYQVKAPQEADLEIGSAPEAAVSDPVDMTVNTEELLSLIEGGAEGNHSVPQDPMKRPPPPLPASVVSGAEPSVLLYPLPVAYNRNLKATLAKALSDALGMKVGPTTIVGKIARVVVPNSKVERRCLGMGSFQCLDTTVFLIKNDRIIDGPHTSQRQPPAGPPEYPGGAVASHVYPYGTPFNQPPDMGVPRSARPPSYRGFGVDEATLPFTDALPPKDAPSHGGTFVPSKAIGVDSDDSDDSDGSDWSSSSSDSNGD